MKYIAPIAKKNLYITKLTCLHGLRFSRVTQKIEWMNRTGDNIRLPKFPNQSSNFCKNQARGIDANNSETVNNHYTAHRFWEQDVPRN